MIKFKILSSLAIFAATFTLFACSEDKDDQVKPKLACEVNDNDSGARMCFDFPNDYWEATNVESCNELEGKILETCPKDSDKQCPIDFTKNTDEIDGIVTLHLYGIAAIVSCQYLEDSIFGN